MGMSSGRVWLTKFDIDKSYEVGKRSRSYSSAQGFIEACCVHRLLFFCRRSRILFKRARQCFLLNGGIFLGSIFLLKYMITPILQWILPVQLPHQEKPDSQDTQIMEAGIRFYSLLQSILISLFYVFWFYPMYVFSFIISTLWYNEIAEQACKVMEQSEQEPQRQNSEEGSTGNRQFVTDSGDNLDGLEGMMTVIAEKIYSCLMLSIFFVEVSAISYVPFIGKILNFLLLSWIYAYYSFEYKWNFIGWSLDKRIGFFETNWAFFAGFGSPCVLPIVFSSQLVSSGIMAILFPLCVLAATATHPQEVIDSYSRRWTVHRLSQVPVFYVPNATSLRLLQFLTFLQSRATRNKKSD
ncbi:hypothetical protein SUGI_0466070 [Cryptomeria japonica]|nr:hypothetical protein SUGI_0466070 [Cryptomeria japonica]